MANLKIASWNIHGLYSNSQKLSDFDFMKAVEHYDIVTKCGFVSRNILGRRCKPLEARAAGNVAA